ncbi:MAG: polymer-forming cytoskeletal protein [Acidiferrobacterales bacterium]
MFDAMSNKPNRRACGTVDALIGNKVDFQGNTTFSGGLRIDGKVQGDVTAHGNNNSTLILSEHAEVQGNITAPHMIINGKITGNVMCSGCIELQPQAEIVGEVRYRFIEVAPGAAIEGRLVRESRDLSGKAVVTKLTPATPGNTKP